jgi:cerevisin
LIAACTLPSLLEMTDKTRVTIPAGAGKAITVGASTLGDERAYFSNHGKCVHVFAPGHNIISTYIGSDTATATLSGTSMASPHTAGLMAYLLSLYPSVFHPEFPVQMVDTLPPMASFNAQHTFDDVSSVYAFVHAVLPRWLSDLVLPFAATEEEGFATAPVPPTLTPQQLKQAVLNLATKDILTQLPPNTVNLLIHNNATK